MEGKAIRFAPGRGQRPAASFWKVWAEGNEIYASFRSPGGLSRISVHASGQIHYRIEAKLKQDLAPPTRLSSGCWLHAFEIRFLVSDGANIPPRQLESLKGKLAHIVPVPEGFVLYANLLVGDPGAALNGTMPAEFLPAGELLWRTQLRDGRPAVLVARILELDAENRDHIARLRERIKPTATFSTMPSEPYVELIDIHWSPAGGNVLLVVPMGNEAFQFEQEAEPSDIGLTLEPRAFCYQSSRCTTDIVAPNGLHVAVLEFEAVDKEIQLLKNRPSTESIGMLRMRLEPANLIAGSKFMASPCKLPSYPSLGGASPRGWEYTVFANFDGFTLSAELRQISAGLRNKNAPVSQLHDREELVMTIPWGTPKFFATMEAPETAVEVLGRFTLRDQQ